MIDRLLIKSGRQRTPYLLNLRRFSPSRLLETHALVFTFVADSLEAAFGAMQIERWPQHTFEAFARVIEEHDLTHTTMCPGDVIEDVDAGVFYECERFGWREME